MVRLMFKVLRMMLIVFLSMLFDSMFSQNTELCIGSKFDNTKSKLTSIDTLFQIDLTQSDLYLEKAIKYHNDEDFDKALFYYYKVLECDSSNIVSYFNIGVIYYNNALTFYIEEEPISLENYNSKIIKADNYFSISKVFFKSVLQYDPDNKEALEIITEIDRRKHRTTLK